MSEAGGQLITRISDSAKKLLELYHPVTVREKGIIKGGSLLLATYFLVVLLLSVWWDTEPELFDVRENAHRITQNDQASVVTGSITSAALVTVMETMLQKRGGYLSNDVAPPGVFMDNIPNWEYGALVQVRDLARALRNDMSRSQSQSQEDQDLSRAEPQFNYQNDSWLFPATEKEYQDGIDSLMGYIHRLSKTDRQDTQFYARADNLREWLAVVEKRLGGLSQRLSASVGQARINTDLAGDNSATQSTSRPDELMVKTPWLEIDDVFYETRGATWALIHFMHAVEMDFSEVLKKKNALVSLRQIIRELEATQAKVWSPVVLNGGGFGIVTNYSLVMANYISRANAAVIDLRNLLEQG